jgi:hypothetical protein
MPSKVVQVPAALLLAPDLAPTAKLIWMVSSLQTATAQEPGAIKSTGGAGPVAKPSPVGAREPADRGGAAGITGLSALSGLSRPTVLKCLAHLTACGWGPAKAPAGIASPRGCTRPTGMTGTAGTTGTVRTAGITVTTGAHGLTVPMPAPLLTDCKLGAMSRVLYGLLLLTPGYSYNCGHFMHAELAALAHASPTTIIDAIQGLVQAEWIKVERTNRLARVQFELTFPGLDRALNAVAEAQWRLEQPRSRGEALMCEWLTLLIDSDNYQDNTNPGFLLNPRTGATLEFDRFYPPRVAFEHNGPQHYRGTKKFTPKQAAAQRERDLIKLGICSSRGITLVTIHPEDLTLQTMQQKAGHLLPLRDLTGYEILIEFLESESRDYQRLMAKI